MQIFGEIPLIKPQNDTSTTDKRSKNDEKFHINPRYSHLVVERLDWGTMNSPLTGSVRVVS